MGGAEGADRRAARARRDRGGVRGAMQLPIYQVDAFASAVFKGNPAAVCPLDAWLPDATMQAIAAENNLAETAFFVPEGEDYGLRWFTPAIEVDLCGHATLASAHVIFDRLKPGRDVVSFSTRSGVLTVTRAGDRLALDFPAQPPAPCTPPDDLGAALGGAPLEILGSVDYMAVFGSAAEVRALAPDFRRLARLDRRGVIATAPGSDCDFVSRFFAPRAGIDEDPVTGSAHCALIPYWARRLGKDRLFARQISARGGELDCALRGDRVTIAGRAVLYLEGTIRV